MEVQAMKLKQYRRYHMDFSGQWLNAFCILCGLSFFLRVEYYFMFINPTLCSTSEVIFSMILPMLLCISALVVLKFFRLNAPGVMGIIGAAMCLCLMIGTFFSGSVLRIVLAILIYLTAGGLLIITIGGFVPTRQFSVISFCLILLVRILFFRPAFVLFPIVLELSELAMLVAVLIMPLTMFPGKMRTRE
jgi:hypothetical protein